VRYQLGFLCLCRAREAVVRGIAKDDDDLGFELHLLRGIEFFPHLREVQFDISRIVPVGKGIRQKYGNPVDRIRPRPKLIKQEIELKLRYGEWHGEDFKSHDAFMEGTGQFKPEAAFIAFAFQLRRYAPSDLKKIGAGATAGIKNYNIGIGEAARPTG